MKYGLILTLLILTSRTRAHSTLLLKGTIPTAYSFETDFNAASGQVKIRSNDNNLKLNVTFIKQKQITIMTVTHR